MYVVIEGMDLQEKPIPIGRIKAKVLELFEKIGHKMNVNTIEEGLTVNEKYDTWFERVLDFARDRAALSPLIKDKYYTDITISLGSYFDDLVYFGISPERKSFIRTVNQFMPEPGVILFLQAPFNEKTIQLTSEYYRTLPLDTKFINVQEMDEEDAVHLIALYILLNWLMQYEAEYDTTKLIKEYNEYVNQRRG